MNAIVICPADRPEVAFLAQSQPLALLPVLGRSLLDLWLSDLAARGARRILVLATDRPDSVRRFVGKGERWGISVEVAPEQRELTPEEALNRHAESGSATQTPQAVVLDHVPPSSPPLWTTMPDWFAAIQSQLESAAQERVGMRQWAPGVFVHTQCRLSPDAILNPPCWIGAHSWVGPRAVIGPNSVVESHSYIDDGAEIVGSFIGPGTYVGALTAVRDSVAWGRNLYKIPTGSSTHIHDAFLLGPVRAVVRRGHALTALGRLLALVCLALSSPILIVGWFRRPRGTPLFIRRRAVRAPTIESLHSPTLGYCQLAGFQGLWKRWPELWNIVRGEFRWVGNRPLTPEQADTLVTEYEKLWLGVPTGVISLADAEGCRDPFGDDARAHSSFFAVRTDWRHRLSILWRALVRPFKNDSSNPQVPPDHP